MCRWVAYSGNPIRPETLLYDTRFSLVEQSRRDRLAGGYPNADGFGLAWYGERDVPGLYRSVVPAWADRNLRELAGQLESPLFLAHVRAATGTPVEQTNCHPFRLGRWLFMHNGFIDGYLGLRRDLLLAVDPGVFGNIEGTTDSEDVPSRAEVRARARAAPDTGADGRIRRADRSPSRRRAPAADDRRGERRRTPLGSPLRERAVVNSLFVTADASAIRALYPEDARFQRFSDEARAIVSEPLGDLPGVWHKVPPGTALVVLPGADEEVLFTPRRPQLE